MTLCKHPAFEFLATSDSLAQRGSSDIDPMIKFVWLDYAPMQRKHLRIDVDLLDPDVSELGFSP